MAFESFGFKQFEDPIRNDLKELKKNFKEFKELSNIYIVLDLQTDRMRWINPNC